MRDTLTESARSAAQTALKHVQHIAGTIGPRPVGSKAEQEVARYVHKQLAAAGLVPSHHGFVAPATEWLPFMIAAGAVALGVVLWLVFREGVAGPYLGAVGIGFGLWEVYAKLTFGWSPLSSLVPRRDTQNVVASIEPSEEVGRNAVVFAHLDSQRTPLLFRSHAALRVTLVVVYLMIAIGLVTLAAFVVSWFAEAALPAWVGIPALVVSVVGVLALLQAQLSPYGPGANDNASAVGVALELARYFESNRLRHTRLWFAFTGAEETGCHGAAAFLGAEGSELIQAYAVALEGCGVEPPAYTLREGTVSRYRSSAELVRILERMQAASPHLGLRPASIRGGYTEAGVAIKRGYRSVALVGLDERGDMPYWHTMADTPDKIRPEALAATWESMVGLLHGLDSLPISVRLTSVVPLSERT
ncbi:MAG: Zn-dependent exopeptidase M28 [Anaerolineae bacterium]|nr:Zn-dependent exopeptidase M28 [Anaerolineae bacterium]